MQEVSVLETELSLIDAFVDSRQLDAADHQERIDSIQRDGRRFATKCNSGYVDQTALVLDEAKQHLARAKRQIAALKSLKVMLQQRTQPLD